MTLSPFDRFVPKIIYGRALEEYQHEEDGGGNDEDVDDEIDYRAVKGSCEDTEVHGENGEFGEGNGDDIGGGEEDEEFVEGEELRGII